MQAADSRWKYLVQRSSQGTVAPNINTCCSNLSRRTSGVYSPFFTLRRRSRLFLPSALPGPFYQRFTAVTNLGFKLVNDITSITMSQSAAEPPSEQLRIAAELIDEAAANAPAADWPDNIEEV